VGVCIDTCHAFAAGTHFGDWDNVGYDIRTKDTYNETWSQFDKTVGFRYLAGLHLNDSRSTLGSKRDLHANLGYSILYKVDVDVDFCLLSLFD
jgi:AP endonuclease 1